MKLYYTDMAAAYIMARDFKVQFTDYHGVYLFWSQVDNVIECWLDDIQPDGKPIGYVGIGFYIHPDSLPIFEPQVGDFLIAVEKYPEPFVVVDDSTSHNYTYECRGDIEDIKKFISSGRYKYKIIQRNGKHFFMPEVE